MHLFTLKEWAGILYLLPKSQPTWLLVKKAVALLVLRGGSNSARAVDMCWQGDYRDGNGKELLQHWTQGSGIWLTAWICCEEGSNISILCLLCFGITCNCLLFIKHHIHGVLLKLLYGSRICLLVYFHSVESTSFSFIHVLTCRPEYYTGSGKTFWLSFQSLRTDKSGTKHINWILKTWKVNTDYFNIKILNNVFLLHLIIQHAQISPPHTDDRETNEKYPWSTMRKKISGIYWYLYTEVYLYIYLYSKCNFKTTQEHNMAGPIHEWCIINYKVKADKMRKNL